MCQAVRLFWWLLLLLLLLLLCVAPQSCCPAIVGRNALPYLTLPCFALPCLALPCLALLGFAWLGFAWPPTPIPMPLAFRHQADAKRSHIPSGPIAAANWDLCSLVASAASSLQLSRPCRLQAALLCSALLSAPPSHKSPLTTHQ